MAEVGEPTTTSYALLGQLALRPWSVYDMTKNIGRTLHWFWPRAESVIYAEMHRLARRGLVRTTQQPGKRGRPQTRYAITPSGRRALRAWLATSPAPFTFQFEALLRVHLAPYGSVDDLIRALESARSQADELLRQAAVVGSEFVAEEHQFQEQVHLRAMLFDYLWQFGRSMHDWSQRCLDEVATWSDIEGDDGRRAQGVELIRKRLADVPRR